MSKKIDYIYDYQNKEQNIRDLMNQIYNRSLAMFKYHNLPETIPVKFLERYLQENGFVCIAKVDDELYAFNGGLGGKPDVYNQPTECIVSNPALNLSKSFKIDKDCIIMDNDYLRQGMKRVYQKYARFLIENEVSLMMANINTRIPVIISAGDSNTVESANLYLKQIEDGKNGVITDNAFLESLKVNSISQTKSSDILDDLIRFNQYLKAGLYNAMGLTSNSQMKKERLISAEIEVSNNGIYPIVDNMLECRRAGIQKINDMFGTDIQVEFNSSWDYRLYQGESIHNVGEEVDVSDLEDVEKEGDEIEKLDEKHDEQPEDEAPRQDDISEGNEGIPEAEIKPEESDEEDEPEGDNGEDDSSEALVIVKEKESDDDNT